MPHRADADPSACAPLGGPGTTLWLVRHGQAGAPGVLMGHADPPLSEAGECQAEAAATALASLPLAALYASDLARARATAEAVSRATGLPAACLPELRERDFGAWEGRAVADLARDDPDALAALWGDPAFAPPGGESLDDLAARVLPALRRIVADHPGAAVAVVGHAGAHRALLADALHLSPGGLLRLGLDPGHACVVHCFPDGGVQVAALNLPPVAWGHAAPAPPLTLPRTRNERLALT